MDIGELCRMTDQDRVISFARKDLDALLEQTEFLRQGTTGIAGRIRTLRLGDRVLVQERNPEGEHFLRVLPSEEVAARFVDARLASYERMWDG